MSAPHHSGNGSPVKRAPKPERIWPIAIAATLVVFVLSMAGFLVFASLQNRDLVVEGYYAQGLDHESQIMRQANALALPAPVTLDSSDPRELTMVLPEPFHGAAVEGEILMYRPSNAAWDRHYSLEPDERGRQSIDLRGVPAGLWRLKLTWSAGEDEYYFEDVFVVN